MIIFVPVSIINRKGCYWKRERERERLRSGCRNFLCSHNIRSHDCSDGNCSFFYQGVVFIWVKQEHVWNAPVQDLCHEVVEGSSNAMWHSFWMVLMTLHWWPAALQRSLSSTKDPGRLNRNCSTVFQHRCAYLEKRNLTLETRGWLLGWLPGLPGRFYSAHIFSYIFASTSTNGSSGAGELRAIFIATAEGTSEMS